MSGGRHRALGRLLVAGGTGAMLACGSGGDTATGSFTVEFPSTAAAIAAVKMAADVQVSAYAASALGGGDAGVAGACQTLVEQSLTNNLTATAAATSAALSPCDLMNGKGSLPISYGSYAFLAVAQASGGQSFLIGCAEQTISASNTVVVIPLTIASTSQPVPTTKCTSLSQACPSGGGC